jgi:hypothetical protein
MLYYSNEVRETARKEIARLHAKLSELPLDGPLSFNDVGNLLWLLRILDDELKREIKENK